jgi:hypothetical protein
MRSYPMPFAALRNPAAVKPEAAALLLVFAAAVAVRAVIGTNVDVSWLLTVGERMLGGERLYVDLIEVNPPASALLYLPAILLARALGVSPEAAVDALALTAAGLSLWLCARILAPTRIVEGNGWLLAGSAVALTILPMHTFGEREHIATVALLPVLAVLVVRVSGAKPALAWAIIAGIGAGFMVAIKPHFALALGCAIATAAYARGSWRLVFALENWIAGALAAAYAIYVLIAYPEFIRDAVPLVQAAYLPMRLGVFELAVSPPFLCWLVSLALLMHWQRGRVLAPPFSLLLAAALGFAAAYFIQGKGWPYHVYPMLALTFIALTLAMGEDRSARPIPHTLAAAALMAASAVWLNVSLDTSALVEPIRRLKERPALLAITSHIALGHPLTRELGGRWVSRVAALWISTGVYRQLADAKLDPGTRARLEALAARDRAWLADDIGRNRPDIIVVEKAPFDWEAWARADPLIAGRLRAYRRATLVGDFLILQRDEPG